MKITQTLLKKLLASHKLWLETNGVTGERMILRGADLLRANLYGAELSGSDMSQANLLGVDLWRANVQEVDLRGADLRGARLDEANLHGANLHGADLRWARLQGADLHGADLREANLCWADLQEADLCGADLPLSIRDCSSFHRAKFTSEALPWLILHPQWSEWKDSVQIEAE